MTAEAIAMIIYCQIALIPLQIALFLATLQQRKRAQQLLITNLQLLQSRVAFGRSGRGR